MIMIRIMLNYIHHNSKFRITLNKIRFDEYNGIMLNIFALMNIMIMIQIMLNYIHHNSKFRITLNYICLMIVIRNLINITRYINFDEYS